MKNARLPIAETIAFIMAIVMLGVVCFAHNAAYGGEIIMMHYTNCWKGTATPPQKAHQRPKCWWV